MVKIELDEDNPCIGCGACAAVCPDNWVLGDDGKAKPKKAEVKEIGCNQEAADSCPVGHIKIIN